ncbi:hypothetical protein F6455_05165 [Proteobacteria bacterium 005FR1]|nr:hypothetical protein [Proteobacteria bacterium 005FR1]
MNSTVIPAKAGICERKPCGRGYHSPSLNVSTSASFPWIPAFAGMTQRWCMASTHHPGYE